METDFEGLIEETAEHAASTVHKIVWLDGQMSAAQARLCWMRVVQKLVQSDVIDRQSAVITEQMLRVGDSPHLPEPPAAGTQ